MLTMDDAEALARAQEELAPRRRQMTEIEFFEACVDRARELLDEPPLARLTQGRRLTRKQLEDLEDGIDAMLSDFYNVARFGDARIDPNCPAGPRVYVLFRLAGRPDIGYTVMADPEIPNKPLNFLEIGRAVAVRLYDALEPKVIAHLMRGVLKK